MGFSIRSAKVERKAREFAAEHGTTLTGGLELALDTAKCVKEAARGEEYRTFKAKIRAIQDRVAQIPRTDLTEDEIMGWDEHGLPT